MLFIYQRYNKDMNLPLVKIYMKERFNLHYDCNLCVKQHIHVNIYLLVSRFKVYFSSSPKQAKLEILKLVSIQIVA